MELPSHNIGLQSWGSRGVIPKNYRKWTLETETDRWFFFSFNPLNLILDWFLNLCRGLGEDKLYEDETKLGIILDYNFGNGKDYY